MRTFWPTSRQMDQTRCGAFLVGRCLHWSSYTLQLISQLGPLTILFPREKCSLFPVFKSTLMLVFVSLEMLPEWLNTSSCKTKFEERKNEHFRGDFLNSPNMWTVQRRILELHQHSQSLAKYHQLRFSWRTL